MYIILCTRITPSEHNAIVLMRLSEFIFELTITIVRDSRCTIRELNADEKQRDL